MIRHFVHSTSEKAMDKVHSTSKKAMDDKSNPYDVYIRTHTIIFIIGAIVSVIVPIAFDFYNNQLPVVFICLSMIVDNVDKHNTGWYIKGCILSIVIAIYAVIYWGQIYNIVTGVSSSTYIILNLCYVYTVLFISMIVRQNKEKTFSGPMILTSSLLFVAFASDLVGQIFRNFIDEPFNGFKILTLLVGNTIVLAQVCGVILVVLIYVVTKIKYPHYNPSIHTPFPLYIPIVCVGLIFNGFGMTSKSIPYITYMSSIFYSTGYLMYCFEWVRLKSIVVESDTAKKESGATESEASEKSHLLSREVIEEKSIFIDSSSDDEEDKKSDGKVSFEL